jgi:hypothetical protein
VRAARRTLLAGPLRDAFATLAPLRAAPDQTDAETS